MTVTDFTMRDFHNLRHELLVKRVDDMLEARPSRDQDEVWSDASDQIDLKFSVNGGGERYLMLDVSHTTTFRLFKVLFPGDEYHVVMVASTNEDIHVINWSERYAEVASRILEEAIQYV